MSQNNFGEANFWLLNHTGKYFGENNKQSLEVILCASEQICLIVRYCYRSFKQLKKDPLHVLTDAYVLV